MKKFELFSEVQIKQWLDQLEVIHENLQANFTFDREMILHESEVCEILQVSDRTMRTYRKNKKLYHIKLGGNIFYLKVLLYIDLILHATKRK